MSGLEKILSKWNFKKIAIVYIVVTVITAIICMATVISVFRNRIFFALQYSHVSEVIEHGDTDNLKNSINKLAICSTDVIDILMLDNKNNVTYSAKNSIFGEGNMTLSKEDRASNYLVSDKAKDVVFKYVKGKEFMFASVFNRDFGEIKDEYEDESFYENNFSNKTVYMLSFLKNKDASSKVYIISRPTSVPGGILTLKICASIAMFLFMIYWVLLALWTYQNSAKAKLYPLLWGIIVLLTNIAGVIIYLLYKHGNITCPECGASQSKSDVYCSNCGTKLCKTCNECGLHISEKDKYCPHCGTQIK